MALSITTDVHCDLCARWAHYACGPRARVAEAHAAARRAGWTVAAGRCVCPACNGRTLDYWASAPGEVYKALELMSI